MDDRSLSHDILHTFFWNFYPSINNNGLIKSTILNDKYISNKERIRFMSNQYLNEITNESEKKFKPSKMSIN